jgi:hypothetical protein
LRSCWAVHACVGWRVAALWTTRRQARTDEQLPPIHEVKLRALAASNNVDLVAKGGVSMISSRRGRTTSTATPAILLADLHGASCAQPPLSMIPPPRVPRAQSVSREQVVRVHRDTSPVQLHVVACGTADASRQGP